MGYIALYRKWRPLIFEDIVDQEHVVKTLKNAIKSERIAHAYLFSGTRGTGKTTMAKILSRAINCLEPQDGDPCNKCMICKSILSGALLDVIEIDAASNNSVDNIREIRDEVVYTPSQAKYKVYIVDEVHMLSTGAFNALLKTLEEPPEHVVFILATTEPHKLPATILSRCQRFDFRRISARKIAERLDKIAKANEVNVHEEALRFISKVSEGALRDAISILDQCISIGSKEVSYEDVLKVIGCVNTHFLGDIADALEKCDVKEVLERLDILISDGKDISQFVSDLILYYRNILICGFSSEPNEILELNAEDINRLKEQFENIKREKVVLIIKELSSIEFSLKWASHPRILLEVLLLKICENNFSSGNMDFEARINFLEDKFEEVKNSFLNLSSRNIIEEQVKHYSDRGDSSNGGEKEVLDHRYEGPVVKIWDKILNDLRKNGRMAIYANLLDTRAAKLEENVLGIIFGRDSGFKKMFISKPENIEILEEILNKRTGKEIRVKCIDSSDFKEKVNESMEEMESRFLKKAENLAKRGDININIIDE